MDNLFLCLYLETKLNESILITQNKIFEVFECMGINKIPYENNRAS